MWHGGRARITRGSTGVAGGDHEGSRALEGSSGVPGAVAGTGDGTYRRKKNRWLDRRNHRVSIKESRQVRVR